MARKMAEGYNMLHRRCTEKQKPRTVDGRGGDGSWGRIGEHGARSKALETKGSNHPPA